MARWSHHVLALLLPACFHPQYDRPACGPGGECPSGLACSAANICESGADTGRDAGVDAAEADASATRPDAPTGQQPDATTTAPQPDAQQCFGTGLVKVCLMNAPSQAKTLSTPLDTSVAASCTMTQAQTGGPELCVVAGTTVTVNGNVIVTGSRALVLIGTDMVNVSGTLDASSATSGTARTGAAANTGACNAPGAPDNQVAGAGGAAGGSLSTRGGSGGNGNQNDPQHIALGGTAGNAQPTPTLLRGGCPGGKGGNSGSAGGAAGDGGGAVYLIGGASITVTGSVFASGAGGGAVNDNTGMEQGGGGGGAGGMIGLDAPTVTLTAGKLVANGGAGGGGGGIDKGGTPGKDGTTVNWDQQAVAGGPGVGGSVVGGALGTAVGKSGAANNINGPNSSGGGGGGGGGLGYIWIKGAVTGATTVSPTPIVVAP